MKQNYGTDTTETDKKQILPEQNAFHEAAHVAAFYRCKKHNNFPDSFFPDDIYQLCCNKGFSKKAFQDNYAKGMCPISGERNIINPPVSLIEIRKIKPLFAKSTYQPAYKANIINLLAGPLAEAKYVSLRDDESFNERLVHVDALSYYSGSTDLEKAYEHLGNFIDNQQARHRLMTELFSRAFAFIDDSANWKAIASLAKFILKNNNKTISCVQAFKILDEYLDVLTDVLIKSEKKVLSI